MVRAGVLVGGLLLLSLLMVGQALLPSMDSSMRAGALLDAGHVPLFVVLTFLILLLLRLTIRLSGSRRILHYLLAVVLLIGMGLGTEFVQKFGARDAGWGDFGRDLLGGGAALLVALAFDRQTWRGPVVLRIGLVLVAVGLVGFGFLELYRVHRDYQGRDVSFPAIAGFESPWEARFVHGHDADLERTDPPVGWGRGSGDPVGRLDTRVVDYPSLSVREPFPDWSGYAAFEFEVWSELESRIDVTVRVHDERHNGYYSDRFSRSYAVMPGANRISIPLSEIESGPAKRALDLEHVAGLSIMLAKPKVVYRLWFDDLRLVRE